MNFDEKSIVTESGFRPKPLFKTFENPKGILIVTPWGSPDGVQKIFSIFDEMLNQSVDSEDETKVVSLQAQETSFVQKIKRIISRCNQAIYSEINEPEINSFYEMVLLIKEGNVTHWFQVGAPNLYLRSTDGTEVLATSQDYSTSFKQNSPVPTAGLGLSSECEIRSGYYASSKNTQLAMCSGLNPSSGFWQPGVLSIEKIVPLFTSANKKMPAWVGLISGL